MSGGAKDDIWEQQLIQKTTRICARSALESGAYNVSANAGILAVTSERNCGKNKLNWHLTP